MKSDWQLCVKRHATPGQGVPAEGQAGVAGTHCQSDFI